MTRFKYAIVNLMLLALLIVIAMGIFSRALDVGYIAFPFAVFFLLTDLIDIRTRRLRMVTNFAGAIPFVVFANPFTLPFLAGIVALFKKPVSKEFTVSRRLYRGLQYFVMYGTAALLVDWSWNPYLSLVIFAIAAKAVNFLLSDIIFLLMTDRPVISKASLTASMIELFYFLVLGIAGGLMWTLNDAGFRTETALVFLSFPLVLILLRFYGDFRTTSHEREEYIESMNSLRYKLSKLLEMISFLRTNPDFEKSLNRIAEGVRDHLGYKYCLISMLDRRKNQVRRIAHSGLKEEDFRQMQENAPPLSFVEQFIEEKYRISRSYFVPEGSAAVETVYSFRGEYQNLIEEESSWRPDDLLIIPIWKSNEIVGYISADAPTSGRRPSFEDIELLEIVADQTLRIIEESRTMDELLKATKTDMATGLYTHTEFYSFVSRLADDGKQRFSIIMIDIDDFKKVNDSFGHIVGDRLIEAFADTIRSVLRKEDFAARYGGDEFAAVIADTSKRDAITIAQRLMERLRQMRVDGAKVSVTCSMGIAEFPVDDPTGAGVVSKADKALYTAKKTGKNKIYVI